MFLYTNILICHYQDSKEKLDTLEKQLLSGEVGFDLRSSKELLRQNQQLESEMDTMTIRIGELLGRGNQLAAGHFDSCGIRKSTEDFKKRYKSERYFGNVW